MSLQLAAQHLSSQGRGNDSTLVHMSPREVKSLNDLAMAHGGQLSINPQTGLPEAGFLSTILPMVAGFALGPAGYGLTAAQAGMAAGALGFAMTGSLEKGLMAGLGAYGGAGIGGSLTEVGMDAAVAKDAAVQAAQENAAKVTENFYNPTGGSVQPEYVKAAQQASADAAAAQAAARTNAQAAYDKLPFMEKMGQSFDTLKAPGGASGLFDKISSSPMSLLKTVGSAAAPAIGESMKPKPIEEEKSDADMGQRYGFSMNRTGDQKQVQPGEDPLSGTQSPTTTPFPTPDIYGREQRYFAPSYTDLTPEEAKKLYGYAEGGVAKTDPPADAPALQMFKQMQAERVVPPTVAKNLMQASMTGGIPTSEFDRYGGYDKVKAMYNSKGGSYDTPTQQTGGANYVPPTQQTGGARYASLPTTVARDPTTVQELYSTYLNRTPDSGGLEHWTKRFGPNVDVGEAALFLGAAAPEIAANKKLAQTTGGPLAQEFNEYQRQTVGAPNRLQAPTAPTTPNSDSELIYDPIKQTYNKNPSFVDASAASDDPLSSGALAGNFAANNPGVPYSNVDPKTGKWTNYDRYGRKQNANGGLMDAYAGGGMSHLGDYSDGGRLLRGPGDGVSDSIPAMIGKRQPARLADGEFVVPARIVSELGNGSTEAGARKLYAMMDRIQKARGKTVGKGKVAKNSRSEKYLPA